MGEGGRSPGEEEPADNRRRSATKLRIAMKNAPKVLTLLLLTIGITAQAIAQPRCPVRTDLEIARMEMQHEKLLLSNDADLQKIALDNIAGLSKACDGKITFERLVPTLVRVYEKAGPEDQVVIADALYAVNEAAALRNLQHTIRGISSRARTEALWAHILQSRQVGMSLQ